MINNHPAQNHLGPWKLLPPLLEGACPICGMPHAPEMPHNQEMLHYQYHFFNEHGRWPTWKDAMAHCTPEVQQVWAKCLFQARGIKIEP